MSRVPSASTSSTNFETIFAAALKEYKRQTKNDITSHPLAAQLQSCDSPSAILTILRTVQTFDQSQSADERWTKWLDPTVNVLYAFSATLGNGAGLIFPPSSAIFAGIGVLLQTIKDVQADQDTLIDLFGRMEYFFKRLEAYIEVRPTAAMTDIIVKIMAEVLSILGIATKEVRQGRTKKYLKKLIGRRDVEEALQRLDRLTQEEALMAATEALKISRGIDNRVKDVGEMVEGVDERVQSVDTKVEGIDNKVQGVDHKVGSVIEGVKETGLAIRQVANQVTDLNRNELRKDLRKWVTPPDPSVNYNAASGGRHEGTAAWWTKGSTLADWKTSGSLLWIHGKIGSGKSVLSSVIIRDIKSLSKAGSAYMAYFFFDFKDTGKQDSRALLSSLLLQLSDRSEEFCDVLLELHSEHENGLEQPTDDSLTQCLKDMLAIMGQVPIYLIMDALDECPNDSGIPPSREKVLNLMKELVELHHPNLRLCVTSRPEFDIRTALEPLATQQVSLHDEVGQKQDIVDYVTYVVHSDNKMKRWRDDDKNMVIEELTKKADGMFRWVFCQLEVLRPCFPTNLRHILDELPRSLDETYKRILKEINNANREHAYRLLQCLAVASRPLRVEELAEVLAFDFSTVGIPKLVAGWRWEDREEAVLSACSSLVSVISNKSSRVVQFSHFSVKEFLTSDRLTSFMEDVSRFHIPIEPSHVILAQASLGVLLGLDDSADEDSVKKIPLFRYAAEYWHQHAQIGDVELQIKGAMDSFFDMDKPHFSAWVRTHGQHDFLKFTSFEQLRSVLPAAAPLYFAAKKGFRFLVERLIVKHPRQVNDLDGLFGTPLHASVLGGHIEVSQLLVEHGADIHSHSTDDWTPLHIASREGHVEVGKWLLNLGADAHARSKKGVTPLHFAADKGHIKVAQMILERNVEVNSRNNDNYTPLMLASWNGHPDVVRLLLDHNANTDVRDNDGDTPLHLAVQKGHIKVAQIILEHNVEVDSRNDKSHTPLMLASWNGDPDVVRLLLDHKAGAHVRSSKGDTPLHFAVDRGHIKVARIVLGRNVEVNSRNDNSYTPLMLASWNGYPDVVRLLLDHSADAHVRSNKGDTPLHLAAAKGHIKVAQIILECNVEVNSRNDNSYTPLMLASWNGHPDVVRLMLDHSADTDVRDNDGNIPLHLAVQKGHLKVAQIILEHNVEVDSWNDNSDTPLMLASQKGHLDVVQLLLDYGADVQVRSLSGKTASEVARGSKQHEIVQLLSQHAAE